MEPTRTKNGTAAQNESEIFRFCWHFLTIKSQSQNGDSQKWTEQMKKRKAFQAQFNEVIYLWMKNIHATTIKANAWG